jgi:hypothetical protein
MRSTNNLTYGNTRLHAPSFVEGMELHKELRNLHSTKLKRMRQAVTVAGEHTHDLGSKSAGDRQMKTRRMASSGMLRRVALVRTDAASVASYG